MTESLAAQYEVEKEKAERDVKNFVDQLKQKGFVEESFEE